jgi:transcriptional regulator with PAS, ATPase and Fis domain
MIEKLCKEPHYLMNVFETMRDGLMIVDKDGNILFFNRAAEAYDIAKKRSLGSSARSSTATPASSSPTRGGKKTAAYSRRARLKTRNAASGPAMGGPSIF